MNLIPMFAVGLGIEKVPDGLPFARKIFVENKNLLHEVLGSPNHFTTLMGYKRNTVITNHKNTENLEKLKYLFYTNAYKFFCACGYDIDKYDLEVVNLWLNEMKAGGKANRHIHYGYQISGCYYVDMPKGSENIMFFNGYDNPAFGTVDSKAYTMFNSGSWHMNPEEGDMYFWRSDIEHQVVNNKFEGIRRTIAFDINVIDRIK